MTLLQNCQIVDSEADCMQMSLNHALLIDPQAQLGGKVGKVLDFHGFDRVAAHTAKICYIKFRNNYAEQRIG